MPEALVVLAVFAVAIAAWIGAWMQSRDPASRDPREDLERLRHHAAWLDQRLVIARRENWDGEMIANLSAELHSASEQLARAGSEVTASSR